MVDVELKDGYNKTTLGIIPNEWKLKQIGDVIEFQGGAQPPKETFINDPKEGYIRLIQIRDYKTERYKTYIPKEMARKFCAKDDIMIGRYGPPIFQILFGLEGAYNVALLKAIPNEQVLNKEYARFFLATEKLFELIDRLSQRTSGQTGVDMEALNNYLIPIPTLKEQEKIVEILLTVDSQIDDTDKLIEKTKELKNGLMQTLLTKGIGHKEFKKSEVGEIPVEWEVKKLKDIVDICYGKSQKEVELSDGKYNILGTGGIIGYTNDYLYDEPSVLIGRKGTINKPQYIEEPFWTVDTLFYTKIKEDNIARWLFYYLNYIDLSKYNEATGVPSLSISNLNNIEIITPSLKEQDQIVDILLSVDTQIEEYENKKIKLEELKKGLMQQLLTGKMRVKI